MPVWCVEESPAAGGLVDGEGLAFAAEDAVRCQVMSSGRKRSSFFHSAFSSIQRRQSSSGMRVPFSG